MQFLNFDLNKSFIQTQNQIHLTLQICEQNVIYKKNDKIQLTEFNQMSKTTIWMLETLGFEINLIN